MLASNALWSETANFGYKVIKDSEQMNLFSTIVVYPNWLVDYVHFRLLSVVPQHCRANRFNLVRVMWFRSFVVCLTGERGIDAYRRLLERLSQRAWSLERGWSSRDPQPPCTLCSMWIARIPECSNARIARNGCPSKRMQRCYLRCIFGDSMHFGESMRRFSDGHLGTRRKTYLNDLQSFNWTIRASPIDQVRVAIGRVLKSVKFVN